MHLKYLKDRALLSDAGLGCLLGYAARNLVALHHYYILQRSLKGPLPEEGRLPAVAGLWPATEEDMSRIRGTLKSLDPDSRRELVARLVFYRSGFRNCHLAKTRAGEIACMQWLIYPYENEVIERHYRRKFIPLREGQVMIENAFTFPRYRGTGVMRHSTLSLLRTAREEGYGSVVAYIRKERIVPLNEFLGMGFRISRMVSEYKVAGFAARNIG